MNNLRILRIKNAIFAGYYFHMKTSINRDFQIYISVPLSIPRINLKKKEIKVKG